MSGRSGPSLLPAVGLILSMLQCYRGLHSVRAAENFRDKFVILVVRAWWCKRALLADGAPKRPQDRIPVDVLYRQRHIVKGFLYLVDRS